MVSVGNLLLIAAQGETSTRFLDSHASERKGASSFIQVLEESKDTIWIRTGEDKSPQVFRIRGIADLVHSVYLQIKLPYKCSCDWIFDMLQKIVVYRYLVGDDFLSGDFIKIWLSLHHPEWFQTYQFTDVFLIPLPIFSDNFTQNQWGLDLGMLRSNLIVIAVQGKFSNAIKRVMKTLRVFPSLIQEEICNYRDEDAAVTLVVKYYNYNNFYRNLLRTRDDPELIHHHRKLEFPIDRDEIMIQDLSDKVFVGIPHSIIFQIESALGDYVFDDLHTIEILCNTHVTMSLCPTSVRMDCFTKGLPVPVTGVYFRNFSPNEAFEWDRMEHVSVRIKCKKPVRGTVKIWHLQRMGQFTYFTEHWEKIN